MNSHFIVFVQKDKKRSFFCWRWFTFTAAWEKKRVSPMLEESGGSLIASCLFKKIKNDLFEQTLQSKEIALSSSNQFGPLYACNVNQFI
ncbi:hypothetical protein SAMN05421736_10261 [Evansella caseinilytica]|uniref:Uncharacterized protein n=1 Tax=Evansella caseinilytica TaxID=1503961 RepID=A0A1H3K643_9BACI|nr:hypothetical protein SAMN05421736_10261 [Evansella caseinilytica]